ncbi:hypothetical protein [Streptomyces sp. B93]|uniref:hypothetical protein n=1 Tax=Streptomyces sp. B93 TaxID=2824875 RepID=UPI001B35F615|nr:hypothetical protein [Streptomyces sp. B93]MBQ1090525.1 hypothetical protein [Streptomyces sp. B93]
MAGEFSDERIRGEISAYLGRHGRTGKQGLRPEDVTLSRWHLLEGEVIRCIESRTEGIRHAPGDVDLADRPVYDDINGYPLAAPKVPVTKSVELVRRGTVHRAACGCDNGRRQCARCEGKGHRACEPAEVCSACEGVRACTQYLRHGGKPPGPPPRPPKPGPATPQAPRVTCEGCGTAESACPRCRGWGRTRCSSCKATGRAPCKDCGERGTTACGTCAGQGSLTTWTGGLITWRLDSDPLPAPQQRPRAVRSELDTGDWQVTLLAGGEPLPDDLSPQMRAAVEPVLRRPAKLRAHERERAYWVDLRRITVARGELTGPHRREFYVFPGPGGRLRVVGRLTRAAKGRAAAVAVAVLALVVLALLLVR